MPLVRLEHILGTHAKVRIARHLWRQPDRWFTEADLARAGAMSRNTVNLAVRDLVAAGVARAEGEARGRRVQFNERSPLAAGLRALFESEAGAADQLAAAARPILGKEASCTLFGSAARGEGAPSSDVDLLVVARSRDRAVVLGGQLAGAFRNLLPGPYRFLYLVPSEVRSKWEAPLLRAVRAEGVELGGLTLEAWR